MSISILTGGLFICAGLCTVNGWLGVGAAIILIAYFSANRKTFKENSPTSIPSKEEGASMGAEFGDNLARAFDKDHALDLCDLMDGLAEPNIEAYINCVDLINKAFRVSDHEGVVALAAVILKYIDLATEGKIPPVYMSHLAFHEKSINKILEMAKDKSA